jgi:DNA-binding NarL/FixJ family response regulator
VDPDPVAVISPTLEATSRRLRVLVADDEALVRGGFAMIIDHQDDMEMVGEAVDGEEAVGMATRLRPDIALLDIRMPRLDGLEAARRILANGTLTRVVMLTTFDIDEYVFRAIEAGASGFLLKDVSPEQLLASIRLVAAGEALLAPAITRRLIKRFARELQRPASPRLEALTEREVEVLRHVATGLTNAEVAGRMSLSPATVKTHVARILSKLALRDRVQLVVLAYESGMVIVGDSESTS